MVEFLSNFSISQMLFCALLLFPKRNENPSIWLYIILMLCGCGYLLSTSFHQISENSVLWWLGFWGGNALPGVFWLVSLSVFGDHVVLKRWQYIVASLTLMVPLIATLLQMLFSFELASYEAIHGLVKYGALLLELVLISHALFIAISQWRNDLVEERRYIRGGVITMSGCYIIFVIVFDQLLKIDWPALALIQGALLASLLTGINFFLFNLRESSLFETVSETTNHSVKSEKPLSKEVQKIIDSMAVDKLYQQEGITIAQLAKHLSIHEYKLRNLINGELNYRNFNDFLNFYRIQEVTQNLIEPELSATPVLTLALESGFRSLSSFNKAFKATHGLTPTEYRKKHLMVS